MTNDLECGRVRLNKPNVFLLGAAKCGTTSLASILDQHSEIKVAKSKEPTFFCRHFNVVRNPIDYLTEFATSKTGASVFIDASHGYFTDPDVAPALHLLFPEAKFILILRNPANRAHALYQHMRRHGFEELGNFEQALDSEPIREADIAFREQFQENYWNMLYVRSGYYDEQWMRYLNYFPRSRFFLLSLSELANYPDEILPRICRFLEVEPYFSFDTIPQNQGNYPDMSPATRAGLDIHFEGVLDRIGFLAGRNIDLTSV